MQKEELKLLLVDGMPSDDIMRLNYPNTCEEKMREIRKNVCVHICK